MSVSHLRFMEGDSQLAKLCRAKDWSQHPIGSPENWPSELKTAVSLMLNSKFPMFIAWGLERIFLYNDQYGEILGQKHPVALGQKFEIVWAEIWTQLTPLIEKVDRGESVYLEDMKLFVQRYGYPEEAYFTFSYSPIFNEDGGAAGLFCAVVETTKKVKAEEALKRNELLLLEEIMRQKEGQALADIERQRLYGTLMDAPVVIGIQKGQNLVIEFANKLYSKVIGATEDIRGKTIYEAVPSIKQESVDLILNVLNTGIPYRSGETPVTLDYDRTGKPYEKVWNLIYQPLHNSDGLVDAVMTCAFEVTDQVKDRNRLIETKKQLEDSEVRLKNALSAGKMGAWEIQLPSGFLKADGYFRRFHHIPENEDIQTATNRVSHPDDVQRVVEALENSIKNGAPYACEYRVKAPDGNYKWVAARGEPVYNERNEIISITGVSFEIDKQKQAEFALLKAKQEAEIANATKSSFLANMSHEIRTPLGAILGFSSLLKDRNLDLKERDQYVDTIVRNGNALTRIIDDILDLAKVEAGRLDVEFVPFSLYQLASDVVDLFKDKTKEKGIYLLLNIDENVPTEIFSDPARLRQILVNLIGNAVKFTDNGGVRVTARATSVEKSQIQIRIDVKDTGIGLTPDQRERLFKPFMQADNSMTRKFGGTGLGLALSQRLSQALSGDIKITDCQLGAGCTFSLTFLAGLPLVKTAVADQTPIKKESISLDGVRVLVVDDSPDNQFLVARFLTRNGAHVDTAKDGDEGYSKALAGSYDVVLMDIQMPKMDGYQAKEALDKNGYKKPVIALTAHAMSDERAKTEAAGFAGHLTKPLVVAELLKTVANIGKPLH